MRVGGYVLHRNNRDTLEAALQSLMAVCDEVVALDSLSDDGSVELARSLGARSLSRAWEGYGAARAAAVEALGPCDYVFFLDSDEHLAPQAVQTLRAWRESQPSAPVYRLPRRDWAELDGRRFRYRTEWRARLIRREMAVWRPDMIVHEALPRMHAPRLAAPIEHLFATSVERRSQKEERYALLWALQAHAKGKRPKPLLLQRPAHLVRDGILHGAFLRGGAQALRLAWEVAGYHEAKYRYLRALRDGAYPQMAALYAEGHYGELFNRVREGRLG